MWVTSGLRQLKSKCAFSTISPIPLHNWLPRKMRPWNRKSHVRSMNIHAEQNPTDLHSTMLWARNSICYIKPLRCGGYLLQQLAYLDQYKQYQAELSFEPSSGSGFFWIVYKRWYLKNTNSETQSTLTSVSPFLGDVSTLCLSWEPLVLVSISS